MQRRLAELRERSRCLQQHIQQEEQQLLESRVLRSCSVAQLGGLSRTLQDLVGCESRRLISVSPPLAMLRSSTLQDTLIYFEVLLNYWEPSRTAVHVGSAGSSLTL